MSEYVHGTQPGVPKAKPGDPTAFCQQGPAWISFRAALVLPRSILAQMEGFNLLLGATLGMVIMQGRRPQSEAISSLVGDNVGGGYQAQTKRA